MSLSIFPTLPGQGIRVKKSPRFDTRVATHASGRECRARSYATPLFDFELVFEGLDMSQSGVYGGLGAETMQTLAGFFMAQQGQALPFLYLDPSDSAMTGILLGVGDGANTTFILTHSIGAYNWPIDCVISVTAVYYNGVRQLGPWTYPSPSSIQMPSAPPVGVLVTADYTYGYQVRFSDDVIDLEEFMSLLSACQTVKFQGVRGPAPSWAQTTVTVLIVDDTDFVVPGTVDKIECWSGGAGGVSGVAGSLYDWGSDGHGGGGGGGYAYVNNPSVTIGQVLPITVGAGGTPTAPGDIYGSTPGNKGGDTYVGLLPTPICFCWGAGKGIGGYQFTAGGPGYGSAGFGGGAGGWYPGLDVRGGGGGGGAGGPNGAGSSGAGNGLYSNAGGGGGAGNGGTNGVGCPGDLPGSRPGSFDGPWVGGAGGTSQHGGGAGGDGGSGNGGGLPAVQAGAGAPGMTDFSLLGGFAGPGGGGGGGCFGGPGGNGGGWGGGGGSGGPGLQGSGLAAAGGLGGYGATGGVAITYTLH